MREDGFSSAFIGPGVELGADVVVGPFAILLGPARIGDRVRIGPGAHVGGPPEIATERQNDAWAGDLDHHEVVIGADTVLRDHVVIHHGSVRPTVIGERCWIFSHAYVAHDVVVGDEVTLSAGVALGGHVTVRRGANLGLNVSVHQRRSIGALAMVGMGTRSRVTSHRSRRRTARRPEFTASTASGWRGQVWRTTTSPGSSSSSERARPTGRVWSDGRRRCRARLVAGAGRPAADVLRARPSPAERLRDRPEARVTARWSARSAPRCAR